MAISEDLPGVEVAVTVGGNDLKEYVDPDLEEENNTTTRYIEAMSEQIFATRIKVQKGFAFVGDAIGFHVSVDGVHMKGSPLIFPSRVDRVDYHGFQYGHRVTPDEVRKFTFASLETASDGRMFKDEMKQLKSLGTIVIEAMHRVKVRVEDQIYVSDKIMPAAGVISEKALKGQAISHSTRLAEPEPYIRAVCWETKPVPGHEQPTAVFNFRYRSIENLKIERIVPRTPTPPPLEDRDIASLSVEELSELQRRAKAFRDEQESKIRVKREAQEEEGPRRRKVARPLAGSTQLQIDDEGRIGASPAARVTAEPEVIELD